MLASSVARVHVAQHRARIVRDTAIIQPLQS